MELYKYCHKLKSFEFVEGKTGKINLSEALGSSAWKHAHEA